MVYFCSHSPLNSQLLRSMPHFYQPNSMSYPSLSKKENNIQEQKAKIKTN